MLVTPGDKELSEDPIESKVSAVIGKKTDAIGLSTEKSVRSVWWE